MVPMEDHGDHGGHEAHEPHGALGLTGQAGRLTVGGQTAMRQGWGERSNLRAKDVTDDKSAAPGHSNCKNKCKMRFAQSRSGAP